MKFLNSKILPKGEKSIGDQYSTNDIDITTQEKEMRDILKEKIVFPPFLYIPVNHVPSTFPPRDELNSIEPFWHFRLK
jgi:hypothetical protein